MAAVTGANVLIADDEPNALRVLSAILSKEGYDVRESADVESAIKALSNRDVDAVITDLRMPGKDGMQLFDFILENHPEVPVIFLTAYGTVESAVGAMTRGAFYYFIKPPDYEKLKGVLARAVEQHRLKTGLSVERAGSNPLRIVGSSPGIQKIFGIMDSVKDSESSVLIKGETGTGKEMIARTLHFGSVRRDMPFTAVNCAAIPGELMESELFGYERGAFTGAVSRRIGKFEEADAGTVFLDEISELELPLQAKLLRVLQEREIERIGSSRKIKVRFRLVCSTNRDLSHEVAEGRFREDLYYRINVVQIDVPPLRERTGDIPLLASEFLDEFCRREAKCLSIAEEVLPMLGRYQWPGNIRQLKNMIERAVVLAEGGVITGRELPDELQSFGRRILTPIKTLKEMELQAIKNTLKACRGNKSKAARLLGISRKAFYRRLREC